MIQRTRGQSQLRSCCLASLRTRGRIEDCGTPPDYGSMVAEATLRGYALVWMMWYRASRCTNVVKWTEHWTVGVSGRWYSLPSSDLKTTSTAKPTSTNCRVRQTIQEKKTYVFGNDLVESLGQHSPVEDLDVLLDVPRFRRGKVHDLLEELLGANLVLGHGLWAEALEVPADPVLLLDVEDVADETLEQEDDIDRRDTALRSRRLPGPTASGGRQMQDTTVSPSVYSDGWMASHATCKVQPSWTRVKRTSRRPMRRSSSSQSSTTAIGSVGVSTCRTARRLLRPSSPSVLERRARMSDCFFS